MSNKKKIGGGGQWEVPASWAGALVGGDGNVPEPDRRDGGAALRVLKATASLTFKTVLRPNLTTVSSFCMTPDNECEALKLTLGAR